MISDQELEVLNYLRSLLTGAEPAPSDISQISFSTGIRDTDEVLRALYTLEGKSLVQPQPPGDFTSNQWQITENGVAALRMMANGAA